MHEVGHHLQIEALKREGPERDVFARSAYNRYYYSTFLMARSMLTSINPSYGMLPHKSYPDVLSGKIVNFLRKEKKSALRNHDHHLVFKIDAAISAAKDFARLMSAAYATRIVADYQPQIKVNFLNMGRFDLQGINITDAHGWTSRATNWRNIILDAWRQVDG